MTNMLMPATTMFCAIGAYSLIASLMADEGRHRQNDEDPIDQLQPNTRGEYHAGSHSAGEAAQRKEFPTARFSPDNLNRARVCGDKCGQQPLLLARCRRFGEDTTDVDSRRAGRRKVRCGLRGASRRPLPSKHQESRLVADDCDVPLAGRGVLQPKHFTGMKLSRLAVGRSDREDTPQDREKLHRRSGVIETLLQILSAPMLVESGEERARSGRVASDIDWRSRRSKFIWRSSTVTF